MHSEFSLIVNSEESRWTAHLSVPPEWEDTIEIAYYLLCDGKRVDSIWYSTKRIASFQRREISGRYHVKAFVRLRDEKKIPRGVTTLESNSLQYNSTPYDLSRWHHPIVEVPASSNWPESRAALKNGIFHLTEFGLPLDVLISGFEKFKKERGLLVCFNAAITSRIGTSAPFFSGTGVAKKLDMPIVSISDPTLALSSDILLGWYAGNYKFPDLQPVVAKLLTRLSQTLHTRLIIFGGSGGGFASLATLKHLTDVDATAAVWNPQTSISNYQPVTVRRYLDIAYPQSTGNTEFERLQSTGALHNLCSDPDNQNNNKFIYLQNQSDWHVDAHAKPFAKAMKFEPNSNCISTNSQGSAIWFGNWGVGHTAPPEATILYTLNALIEKKDPRTIASELATSRSGQTVSTP